MDRNRIRILDDEIVGKISAGEVVERPASVVKELLENSIDAGASSVEIEIEDAGKTLVRVADDGVGMDPEDARIACRQHATSKITGIRDLGEIRTLGFRGEALASIASVSRMEISTRTESDGSGVKLSIESGQVQKARPVGRPRGTTVEVRNLFYNVPARKKFLKSDSAEATEIINIAGRFILMNPGIEFKLTHDGKSLFHIARNMGLAERVRAVLGPEIADNMQEISLEDADIRVTGLTSLPSSTRKDRRAQVFFVNGRYVKNRGLSDALGDAYRSMLERGRYPNAVIFVDLPPSDVDVNVHPTKIQVKFDDERRVKAVIEKAVKSGFDRIKTGNAGMPVDVPEQAGPDPGAEREGSVYQFSPGEVQKEFAYEPAERDVPTGKETAPSGAVFDSGFTRQMAPERETFMQVCKCYIVRPDKDGFTVTDQHAAHERVLYELFSRGMKDGNMEVQNMLFPIRLDLSASEALTMEKALEGLMSLGFRIEPFGERSFVVQSVPAVLKDRDIKTVIFDILSDLSSKDLARIDIADELVKLASCRSAIKAGDPLSQEEMRSLVEQLSKCELPFTCPHGRPTVLNVNMDELEKRFRRK